MMQQTTLLGKTEEMEAYVSELDQHIEALREEYDRINHYLSCENCRIELELCLTRYPNRTPPYLCPNEELADTYGFPDFGGLEEKLWQVKLGGSIQDFIVKRLKLAKVVLGDHIKVLEKKLEEAKNTTVW